MQRLRKAVSLGLLLCSFSNVAASQEVFNINLAAGTPLVEALRALSLRANKNVVINGDLKGTVSVSLKDTTFEEALNCLAMVNGFSYEVNNRIVLISPADTMSKVESYSVKHLDLDNLKKDVGLFMPESKINIDKDQSKVTVDGTTMQLDKVRKLLKKDDVAQKQINVEVTVLEVNRTKAREMGLSYTFSDYAKGDQGINWLISGSYEDTKGVGKVLASPSITVFNGKKANVLIGDKVPVFTSTVTGDKTSASVTLDKSISVEYKDIGVKLEVTPRINDEEKGTVSMKLKPSVSSISGWFEVENNKAPQISTREAETELRVKAGETIYIGGLLKDSEIKNIKAIPFLSKLPILGELFKSRSISKQKTEVIIAVTPKIVEEVNEEPKFTAPNNQALVQDDLNFAIKKQHEVQRDLNEEWTNREVRLKEARKLKALKEELKTKEKEQQKLEARQKEVLTKIAARAEHLEKEMEELRLQGAKREEILRQEIEIAKEESKAKEDKSKRALEKLAQLQKEIVSIVKDNADE